MLKSRKNLIIFILILVIIPISLFFYVYNKPHRDINDEEPVVNITANQLFVEYEQNEDEANERFLDKVIIIEGKIDELDISKEDDPTIIIKNAEDFFGVSCSFGKEMEQLLANKKIGDFIKVKGICKGYLSDVVLIDCIIIE